MQNIRAAKLSTAGSVSPEEIPCGLERRVSLQLAAVTNDPAHWP